MDAEAIRRYARRPWMEIEAAKRGYWAEEFLSRGPEASARAAHAIWAHIRAVRPDWPTEAAQRADLEHHAELKRRLDRASRALSSR